MDGYWDERYQEEAAKHEANMMRADEHVYKLEDEVAEAQRQTRQLMGELEVAQAERDEMYKLSTKMLARVNIVVNAMRAGADLNTLYDVIQRELAPLVESADE